MLIRIVSFLGGLFRRVLPWLRRGARAVGKEAVCAGMNVACDVLSKDMNFKDSLRTRARESGKNLKRKAGETIDTLMHGSGYKMGKITRDRHSMLNRIVSRISRINATRGKRKKSAIKKKKKKSGKKGERRLRREENIREKRGRYREGEPSTTYLHRLHKREREREREVAFLYAHSHECLKSELELFSLPPAQTTIEASNWVHYKPISSLTDDSPIEFVVPGQGDEYIDLAHTMLSIDAQIMPSNVGARQSEVKHGAVPSIRPVNNLLHSLFSQVNVYLNQKLVSPPNNAYAYRAYIETLLNYGPAAKKSHLTSALWYDDTPSNMDDLTDGNVGLFARRRLLHVGNSVDLLGHLHCNIFNQERFLLNGVEMRLRLVRSRNNFCLLGSTSKDYTCGIKILEATLLVRRTKVAPDVLLTHARALSKATAKYPLTRVEIKTMSLHAGAYGETIDNVILGQLPKRIIIGFVDNKAFNCDFKLNPFNFHHYKINYLSLYVDGVQISSRPLQPDFANYRLHVDSFHTLFSGTGMHFLS